MEGGVSRGSSLRKRSNSGSSSSARGSSPAAKVKENAALAPVRGTVSTRVPFVVRIAIGTWRRKGAPPWVCWSVPVSSKPVAVFVTFGDAVARVAAPGRVIQSSKKRFRSLPETASATFWTSRNEARFSRYSR
jgi:hypothetical protein